MDSSESLKGAYNSSQKLKQSIVIVEDGIKNDIAVAALNSVLYPLSVKTPQQKQCTLRM